MTLKVKAVERLQKIGKCEGTYRIGWNDYEN